MDGSPGEQESGAKRDQRETWPIRFDPKAAGRSRWFQGVEVWSTGAKPISTTQPASPDWLKRQVQHPAENKEHTKPYKCHARLPLSAEGHPPFRLIVSQRPRCSPAMS